MWTIEHEQDLGDLLRFKSPTSYYFDFYTAAKKTFVRCESSKYIKGQT